MKKLFLLVGLVMIISLSLGLSACSKTKEVEIGKSYNNKTGVLSQKLKEIPAGQYVYIVVTKSKPLNISTADMTIYSVHGSAKKQIRKSTFYLNPNDNIMACPLKIKEPGEYLFNFTSDKKTIAEKKFKVK